MGEGPIPEQVEEPSREAVLDALRRRILAHARRRLGDADAEDRAREVVHLLSTQYGDVADPTVLVALALGILRRNRTGEDLWPLLAGYATDSLGDSEQRTLIRASLDDQELFDSLVEADGPLRPTVGERLRDWFERPATLLDLAVIAVLALTALAGFAFLALPGARLPHAPAAARPLGAPLSVRQVAWLLGLPERQVVPAALARAGFEGLRVRPGATLHLDLRVQAPARVALLDEPGAGVATQVWPGLGLPPALVSVPDGGGQATLALELDVSAAGPHRLRLVVAPPELDLGALSPSMLPAVAARLTLVDLRYDVARP